MKTNFEKLSKKEREALIRIAAQTLVGLEDRKDLDSHGCDAEDFFEASVWGIADALAAAYELGRKSR